ncbi:hypothetical protein AAG906_019590 [Vitis piasezkii]
MDKKDIFLSRPINTVLEGNKNYLSWSQAMRSFLKGRMLWHYCTGVMTIPVKGASEGDAVFLNRMIEWDSHNHMILTWIRNTSIPSISNLMGSFDDAKSAWDMLAKMVELHQLRQEPGQSINDYYDQLRFIWDQIDLSDPTWTCSKDAQQYASIRDEFRLYEFLMSLHKDFEPIREKKRSCNPSSPNKFNVLVITPSTPLIEQPQNRSQLLQRPATPLRLVTVVTNLIANIEPTPPMASTSVESKSSGSTINLSSTELQEIIAQAVRMAGNASLSTALSVLPGKSQTWLFDSACCNHMTPHSSLFSKLDPAPHPLNIHIADGSTMHGNSLGFVSTSNLSVPGVFHVPDLSYNLCSVGQLSWAYVSVSNLHFPPVALFIATALLQLSSLPSLALWHSRLGHASSSRVQQLVSRGTSQQNGRAERKLRHILDTVRALLLSAKIPAPFWGEATLHAVHAINRIPSAVIHNQTPYERLFGSPPTHCFLGYGETQKGIGVMILSHRLRVSRNVVFWEHRLFVELSHFRSSLTNSSILEIFPDESLLPHFETGSLLLLAQDPPQDIPPRHSTRVRFIPPHLLDYHCYTPLLHFMSLKPIVRPLDPLWRLLALMDPLSATRLVLLPKALQEYGIDYEETFPPVARISSARALLVFARQWDLFQMDVKNAFLNGDLSEAVYMQPPPGLSVESNKVCHLRRALYGLKQAPRAWFAKFSSTIFRLGYTASPYDSALFLRRTDKGTILLLLYETIVQSFSSDDWLALSLSHAYSSGHLLSVHR